MCHLGEISTTSALPRIRDNLNIPMLCNHDDMSIDPNFPKENQVIGKHKHAQGKHECKWCMACVAVCAPQAIKVDQSNLQYHEEAVGTFNEELAKSSTSPPHAH